MSPMMPPALLPIAGMLALVFGTALVGIALGWAAWILLWLVEQRW